MSTPSVDPAKAAEFDRLIKERDHYKLLSVSRTCTPEELKKSYRKIALRLHPDRNLGMEEDATVLFAKVQAAYDILSDPQERAYYDQYGSRKGPGGFNAGYEEEEYDDSPGARFTPTEQVRDWVKQTEQYQGATPGGEPKFYKVAGEFFKKLDQEERDAHLKFDPLWEPYPSRFGNSKTNYEDDDLAGFYNRWTSFSTRKTFSWFDKYDVRYAEDRRTRRAMDAANNRIRESEKRKFNDAVRAFARFIKKNDPRFKKYAAKVKGFGAASTEKGKKSAKDHSEEDRKRNAEKRTNYEQQAWERISDDELEGYLDSGDEKKKKNKQGEDAAKKDSRNAQPDNQEDNKENVTETEGSSQSFDDDNQELECVVCDKTFTTQKQLVAHERSKKHIKAVEHLREEMLKEGIELGLDKDTNAPKQTPVKDEPESKEEESDEESSDDHYTSHQKSSGFSALLDSDESESDDEPQAKSSGFAALMESDSDDEQPKSSGFEALMDDSDDDDEEPSARQQKVKLDINDLLAEMDNIKVSDSKTASNKESSKPNVNSNTDIKSGQNTPTKPVGKAKQRRLKKKGATGPNSSDRLNCNVCKQEFSNQNQLFQHIRHTGHVSVGNV